jgi:hypothetical protein
MKNFLKTFILVTLAMVPFQGTTAFAQFFDQTFTQPQTFFQPQTFAQPQTYGFNSGNSFNQGIDPQRAYVQALINFYLSGGQISQQGNFGFNQGFQQPFFNNSFSGSQFSGGTPGFNYTPLSGDSSSNFNNFYSNNNRPDVETDFARDIQDDSAELRGEIDMNDFRDGIAFFVYGQDENKIEDVQDDYEEYDDVQDDEESDDFEVVRVDRGLNNREFYSEKVQRLEEDERYYFIICVEYKDENNDQRLECGDVEDFETERNGNSNSNGQEPDVETDNADNISDNSAELNGSVEMNDFDDGRVFFVWGEDENDIEDIGNESRYSEVNENGDNLQRALKQNRFNGNDDFELQIGDLDGNTDIYFRICVEYQNEDNDDTLECGNVESFETD